MTMFASRRVAIAFGRVLHEVRQRRGLSQDELAALCDFDRTYPSMLERGLRGPSLAMIFRLSDGLGLNPTVLVVMTRDELLSQRQEGVSLEEGA